ncbi:hypothetical protein NDU88_006813 [Pleurodeles waltl]|uniref:Uncharacterized protein n=1 Tax=Pleurodeles waltl TaxID=8319 RepID=A0AAV7PNH2_PLEWA|nr:hypothetical protein NDU88_006813 [Pleurodeles waltl]
MGGGRGGSERPEGGWQSSVGPPTYPFCPLTAPRRVLLGPIGPGAAVRIAPPSTPSRYGEPGILRRRGRARPASHREPLTSRRVFYRTPLEPRSSGGQRPTPRRVFGGADQDFWWARDGAYISGIRRGHHLGHSPLVFLFFHFSSPRAAGQIHSPAIPVDAVKLRFPASPVGPTSLPGVGPHGIAKTTNRPTLSEAPLPGPTSNYRSDHGLRR